MRRTRSLLAFLLLYAGTAGAEPAELRQPEHLTIASITSAGSRPALPAGWRWESYGGLEVGVPGDWRWGDSSPLLYAWCAGPDGPRAPVVGRPGGIIPAIGCPERGNSNPGTLVANTGRFLGFDDALGSSDGVAHEQDRTTIRLDGVAVVIQASTTLRERIAATIHRVRVDSAGCPVTHPVSERPHLRPAPAVAVTELRAVTVVSACKYRLHVPGGPTRPLRLVSGLRLDGAAAARAVQQIARAPEGGGPDDPGTCAPDFSRGDDIIVMRVRSAAGPSEVMLSYSGCVGNGFDDGVTRRRLTAAAVAPLIAGPNEVLTYSGQAEKTPILSPPTR